MIFRHKFFTAQRAASAFILLFSLSSAAPQSAQPALTQPVKTTVSASEPYGVDFSKLSGDIVQITEYKGDDLDDLVLKSSSTYQNRKLQTTMQYEDSTNPSLITKYAYNTYGQLASITGSDSSLSQRWKYEYTYNKSGRQTEEKSFSSVNTLEGRITTKYNDNGSLRERRTYNGKGSLMLKETFQYNDRGFIAADITQYPDGKLLKRAIYSYTKGGHIADEMHYDAGGFYERIGYTYTEGGQLVSFSNIAKDYSVNTRTTLQYDVLGRIAKETITSKDKSVTVLTYIYDSHGNWVWKSDGGTQTLRKIIYAQ